MDQISLSLSLSLSLSFSLFEITKGSLGYLSSMYFSAREGGSSKLLFFFIENIERIKKG